MANTLINSPNLVTTGTDSAELFLVQSAGASASTIVAKAGNDTIQFLEGPASADKVSVSGEGGADLIQVSSTVFDDKSVFAGGAGADTVTFTAGGFKGQINLGDGSDLVQLNGATELNTVTFGAGADRLTASQALSAEGGSFRMGSGADTIDIDVDGILRSAVIAGGGGKDVIILSALDQANTALSVLGGGGGDTISLEIADEFVAKGGAGNDTITQINNGELNESSVLLGGSGADSITLLDISAVANGNVLVGGGAGSDTMNFNGADAVGADVSIAGGGGADSISIVLVQGVGTAGTVFGGAGSDSITFSGQLAGVDTGIATQIGISNFSDSTLSATDLITFDQSGLTTTGATLDFVTDGLGTNLAASDTLINQQVSMTGSIVSTFTSTLTDLTARVEAIDKLATTKGSVVAFEENGGSAAYLFIQGGATDTLVEINEAAALSGIAGVTVANSSVLIELNVN